MTQSLKIGMMGLDTSHCIAFTKLLNDPANPYHILGGNVTTAWPGGSPDLEISWSRLENFTNQLRDEYDVTIVDSPEIVAEHSDAILLTSVDGRIHPSLLERIAPYGKPVFVDKPFALNSQDARKMIEIAAKHQVPVMSTSSLRYSISLMQALGDNSKGPIQGVHVYGPTPFVPMVPGYFWYGIHSAEVLFAVLGSGCKCVSVISNDNYDLITAVWEDGRIGSIRGGRESDYSFGALIHREEATQFVDLEYQSKPNYAGLMEQVMVMFQTGRAVLDPQTTLEVIRFLEAANESRETGMPVNL